MSTEHRRYSGIQEIKRANEAAGQYWFEPGTMRFFHSRILPTVYGGRYFVTSECREPHPYTDMNGQLQPATERRYSVREANRDGSIDTVGPFNEMTKAEAVRMAKDLAHFGTEKYLRVSKSSEAASA